MPTYTYRCKSCRDVQVVTHSMQSFLCPPCGLCGGLTEKIIAQAPAVITQQPEAAPIEQETHHCGSGCVLHKYTQAQQLPAQPSEP